MPEIAGQRLRRIGLTPGDIGGSLQPGKINPETELRGWGTWIRTKIDGVGVPIEPLILFNYFANRIKNRPICFNGLLAFCKLREPSLEPSLSRSGSHAS